VVRGLYKGLKHRHVSGPTARPVASNLLVIFADLGVGAQNPTHFASNRSWIPRSETGLSTTIASSGLLEDARTRPQLPSSTVTSNAVEKFLAFDRRCGMLLEQDKSQPLPR
jgi:hypothetical protein